MHRLAVQGTCIPEAGDQGRRRLRCRPTASEFGLLVQVISEAGSSPLHRGIGPGGSACRIVETRGRCRGRPADPDRSRRLISPVIGCIARISVPHPSSPMASTMPQERSPSCRAAVAAPGMAREWNGSSRRCEQGRRTGPRMFARHPRPDVEFLLSILGRAPQARGQEGTGNRVEMVAPLTVETAPAAVVNGPRRGLWRDAACADARPRHSG